MWTADYHEVCSFCQGTGTYFSHPCPVCKGSRHEPECAGCLDEMIHDEYFEHHGPLSLRST